MKYDFSKMTDRCGSNSLKWDLTEEITGCKDVIPMWVADMDFEAPSEVRDAIEERAKHGIFGYTVRMDSFNSALTEYYKRNHNWDIDTSWIVQSECGLVNGIKNVVEALTEPGDGVILQSPVYHAFYRPIKNLQRRVVSNPLLFKDGRYTMDLEGLKKLITPDVKLMLLCNPHNPVGRVWSRQELQDLCDVLDEYGITLFSDEIHMDLTYGDNVHTPIMTLPNKSAQNAIVGVSATKTFNLAGFYMGSLIIKDPVIKERVEKKFFANEDNPTNAFGVVACEAAYRYGDEWRTQLMSYLEDNVAFVREYLQKNLPQVKLIHPEATYLLWLDCRALGLSNEELRNLFYEKIKVFPSMGADFGPEGEGFVRINVACPQTLLKECLTRMEKGMKGEFA